MNNKAAVWQDAVYNDHMSVIGLSNLHSSLSAIGEDETGFINDLISSIGQCNIKTDRMVFGQYISVVGATCGPLWVSRIGS